MIGLRAREREARLLELAGERAPLAPDELVAAVNQGLRQPDSPSAVAARWIYARWKPGRALACGYEVDFVDGSTRVVSVKSHIGLKRDSGPSYDGAEHRLRPWCVDERRQVTLSLFPFDRELPGLERLFDLRRVARRIDSLHRYGAFEVRPGPSAVVPLRYKPERRAVLRLDLRLRESDDSPRRSESLIARVHPVARAARIAELRRRFESAVEAPFFPRLVEHEERTGVLLEEWLDARACEPESFENAARVGALLARLHATPCGAAPAPRAHENGAEWSTVAPWIAAAACDVSPTRAPVWIHGDLHADQLALAADGSWRLFDFDALSVGDACDDLASWIADDVAATRRDWRLAAAELLDAYRANGGTEVDEPRLAMCVADALLKLAAATLRRLEVGALERSRELAALALHMRSTAPQRRVLIERIDPAPNGAAGARLLTEVEDGERRWVLEAAGLRSTFSPFDDARLPLSAALCRIGGEVQVLAYRPGKRVTVRWRRAEGQSSILKGYRAGKAARSFQLGSWARAASARTTLVAPEPLEFDESLAAVELEDLGGAAVDLATIALERVSAFGAALRTWQAAPVAEGLTLHDAQAELRVIASHLERAQSLGCEVGEGRAALDELEALAAELPPTSLALCHRDLHDGQLLDLGDQLGWLDFDLLCSADDALDVGNLLAHFALRALQQPARLGATRVRELREALLVGFDGSRDAAFCERLEFYERATALRLSAVYALRPPWASLSMDLVRLARSRVEGVRRD